MSKFANYGKASVDAKTTVEYPFFNLEGTPTLKVKSATQKNRPYFNAVLRDSGTQARVRRSNKPSVKTLDEARKTDAKLFAKFVVDDWINVQDTAKKDVPITVEACEEFLNAIPEHEFDGLREFCSEILNFVDEDEDGIEHEEEVIKNS